MRVCVTVGRRSMSLERGWGEELMKKMSRYTSKMLSTLDSKLMKSARASWTETQHRCATAICDIFCVYKVQKYLSYIVFVYASCFLSGAKLAGGFTLEIINVCTHGHTYINRVVLRVPALVTHSWTHVAARPTLRANLPSCYRKYGKCVRMVNVVDARKERRNAEFETTRDRRDGAHMCVCLHTFDCDQQISYIAHKVHWKTHYPNV